MCVQSALKLVVSRSASVVLLVVRCPLSEFRLTCTSSKQNEMSSQGDRFFMRGLNSLPAVLRKAIVEAELDDPVSLRSFRSFGLEKLGVFKGGKHGHVLYVASAEGSADTAVNLATAESGANEVDKGPVPIVSELKDAPRPKIVQEFQKTGKHCTRGEKSAMFGECGASSHDTSKLSAHQMPHAIESSPVGPGSLLLCWTLVHQSILPSGFGREFTAFGDHWEAAAE